MRTPLSIYNLLEGGWRTVLSIVGIGIAILLMFMQLGFLGAVRTTAVVVYDHLDFDLVVRSKDYYFLCDGRKFDRDRLFAIESMEGVASTEPFHATLGKWSFPEENVQRGIFILGVAPSGSAFSDPEIGKRVNLLALDRHALMDTKSSKSFLGSQGDNGFTQKDHVDNRIHFELNNKRFELSGLFTLGAGLAADGAVILSEEGFARVMPGYGADDITVGLVKLEASADPEKTRDRIQKTLAEQGIQDVEVLTKAEIRDHEKEHWISGTPVGFIFFAGVVVAFIVGSIIVYIVLSSDVTRQIGEYATLKAMGYRNGYLARVVLEQAILMAVCAYVGAALVAFVVYYFVSDATNLPIRMDWVRLATVLVASLTMCCVSGILAIQKLRKADPADLF